MVESTVRLHNGEDVSTIARKLSVFHDNYRYRMDVGRRKVVKRDIGDVRMAFVRFSPC